MERERPTRDAMMEGAVMADMPPRLKIHLGEGKVAGRALYGAYTGVENGEILDLIYAGTGNVCRRRVVRSAIFSTSLLERLSR